MPESLTHALSLVLVILVLTLLVRHSVWRTLGRVYPLGEEWPDRSYPGTIIAADPMPYRVTVGANSRGITFHGTVFRLIGFAAFVPWPDVTATPGRSLYFRGPISLTFAAAPTVQVVLPEPVWANVVGHRRTPPIQRPVGV